MIMTYEGAEAVRVDVHRLVVDVEQTLEAAAEREELGTIALHNKHEAHEC